MIPGMRRKQAAPLCTPAAWLTMMAPVRSEIAQALTMLGEASIAEIAEVIDRPADTLYRHVAMLERAGVVVEGEPRRAGRHVERVYSMVAPDMQPDFSTATPRLENKVGYRTASALLKSMSRTVRDAAAAQILVTRPEGRNLSMTYELGRLTPAMYEELRGHLRAIKALMDRGKKQREGTLYLSITVACPVVRRRGAAGNAAAKKKKKTD